MAVYMLKFGVAIGSGSRGRAQYYLGYAKDENLEGRIARHIAGNAAKITSFVIKSGITIELVMVIPNGSRRLERRLKNWHSHARVLDCWTKGTLSVERHELDDE